jgi:hypothetical protein
LSELLDGFEGFLADGDDVVMSEEDIQLSGFQLAGCKSDIDGWYRHEEMVRVLVHLGALILLFGILDGEWVEAKGSLEHLPVVVICRGDIQPKNSVQASESLSERV